MPNRLSPLSMVTPHPQVTPPGGVPVCLAGAVVVPASVVSHNTHTQLLEQQKTSITLTQRKAGTDVAPA